MSGQKRNIGLQVGFKVRQQRVGKTPIDPDYEAPVFCSQIGVVGLDEVVNLEINFAFYQF